MQQGCRHKDTVDECTTRPAHLNAGSDPNRYALAYGKPHKAGETTRSRVELVLVPLMTLVVTMALVGLIVIF
jgi:hypothetical protein